MKERLDEQTIALRVAKEFKDGSVVNLGYGMPSLAANFIPEDRAVLFQYEIGLVGTGPLAAPGEGDEDLINASAQYLTPAPGMSAFNVAEAFDMIVGGHIDIAVLGAYQVSEKGDLANWRTGTRHGIGMGGAMDLAVGAKRLIVAMLHTTKDGKYRIVKECDYPLTAKECVDLIVTDLAVIEVTKEGLVLKEVAPGWSADEIQAITEPRLILAEDLKDIEL